MTYLQLSGRALDLLATACRETSIANVARQLNYSRPAISMALRGKYIGGTSRLAALIFEVFADRVDCPFLGRDIAPAECKTQREAPIPSAPRSAVDHWRACRHCAFNPSNALKRVEPETVNDA